ncbi:MAG: type II secretion system GspH family protein [Lentisphaeraceae bacterium]|nr:type II secretion system GspH family protein [Lentisphaeraceae bacterium]
MKVLKFTLLELLIVIAIIGILTTLLLPSLRNSKELAEKAVCASNYKQIYLGAMLHKQNNNHYLPQTALAGYSNGSWIWAISIALGEEATKSPSKTESEVFTCPKVTANDASSSYSYSVFCGMGSRPEVKYDPVLLTKVSYPAGAWYISEGNSYYYNGNFWSSRTEVRTHLSKTHGVLVDGAVRSIKEPNQNKLHPDWPRYWYQWAHDSGQ